MNSAAARGVWLIILFISWGLGLSDCAPVTQVRGQYFPELINPTGEATLLFFFTESLEYYLPEAGDAITSRIDYQIKRLQMDLTQLSAIFPGVGILVIDVYQHQHTADDHRVYQIPTLILFTGSGYEYRRWTPADIDRGGGTLSELEDTLEAMKGESENKNGADNR